jgi:hypothetical protein
MNHFKSVLSPLCPQPLGRTVRAWLALPIVFILTFDLIPYLA